MKESELKLPEDFKKKWIEALRSGKYTQGKFFLQSTNNTYCCLGVACRVAGIKRDLRDFTTIKNIPMFDNVPKILHADDSPDIVTGLASMNDLENKSFLEIADYIEKEL